MKSAPVTLQRVSSIAPLSERILMLADAVAITYVMQKTSYVFLLVEGRKVEHLQWNMEALEVSLFLEHIIWGLILFTSDRYLILFWVYWACVYLRFVSIFFISWQFSLTPQPNEESYLRWSLRSLPHIFSGLLGLRFLSICLYLSLVDNPAWLLSLTRSRICVIIFFERAPAKWREVN